MNITRLFALSGLVALAAVIGLPVAVSGQTAGETDPIEPLRAMISGGEFAEAEAGALALLAEVESTTGSESIEAAGVLDVLAESRWRSGKAQEPETRDYAERALSIKETILGADHAEVAESLNNVAVISFFLGDYEAARSPWERALAIRERTLGPDHKDVAQSLNNLANLLQTVGDLDGARALYERALAIREKTLGPEDRYVAQSLNNLGWVLGDHGDYIAARAAFERALAIREKSLGPDHPKVGSSLNALASILWKTGDRDRARELFERALEVWKAALGEDHPYVATSMNNLGWLLMNAGEYADAKPLFEGAVSIWKVTVGPDHPEVALGLHNLGEMMRITGDLEQARPLLEQAASIRETSLGPTHPDLAESLGSLAQLLFETGDAEGARADFERSVAIRKDSLGPGHPDVAESLVRLAFLRAAMGDGSEALDLALESERIARDHLRLTARALSEQEALRYAGIRNKGLDLALTLASGETDAAAANRVLDSLIRSRAVVLDEMAARSRTIVTAGDPNIARLAEELSRARARLANLTVRGLGDEDPDTYSAMLETARREKEDAERALAGASVAFAREQAQGKLGILDVASGLPKGSALVAFLLHDRAKLDRVAGETTPGTVSPPDSEPAYTALVIRTDRKAVAAVSLGTAREIDDLVSSWKREAAAGASNIRRTPEESEAAYRVTGDALRERIWDPLLPALRDAELVFLVPDGALNLVSFASLPVDGDRYLLERGPALHYLSAERDLVLPSNEPDHGRGLLVLGGPDYDNFSSAGQPPPATAAAGPTGPPSATRSSCGSFDTLNFKPLPAAEREAAEIAALWREATPEDSHGTEGVVHLSGQAAGESAFKQRASGRRVLHVATHGFFLGGDCAPTSTRSRGFAIVEEPEAPSIPDIGLSPLLRSGLALAGANQRRTAGSADDDGVLTAEEIASLDLSGVEWAVLSACDTGVGEIEAGEGVFGLRRAIQVAGVRTLIMSLWPVDDEATRQWMTTLYRSRLEEGSATVDAVRAAASNIVRTRRESGESTHPFYWAAFVAAGDWR